MMERDLSRFYTELAKWVDKGCRKHHVFKKHIDIQGNLVYWLEANNNSPLYAAQMAARELNDVFVAAGLHPVYPFNGGCAKTFGIECAYGEIYQNEARLKWIRDHAKDEIIRNSASVFKIPKVFKSILRTFFND